MILKVSREQRTNCTVLSKHPDLDGQLIISRAIKEEVIEQALQFGDPVVLDGSEGEDPEIRSSTEGQRAAPAIKQWQSWRSRAASVLTIGDDDGHEAEDLDASEAGALSTQNLAPQNIPLDLGGWRLRELEEPTSVQSSYLDGETAPLQLAQLGCGGQRGTSHPRSTRTLFNNTVEDQGLTGEEEFELEDDPEAD